MVPFSRQGATHFCSGFSGQVLTTRDLSQLYNAALTKSKSFKEGDGIYESYRDTLLREADRSFFLAVSCYRRALDLFTASSAFWAHVSLYYSSWFAANAVLGMFGCWVCGPRRQFRIVIEVSSHIPGGQQLRVEKNYSTIHSGSHRMFWDAYYRAMKNAVLWTDASLQLAVTPISNSPTWPIDRRNTINYQTINAFDLIDHHIANFDANNFPNSLQGETVTQFQLARSLLLFAAERAKEFNLKTDVFRQFSSRADAITKLIYRTIPSKLSKFAEETRLTI